ncbi:hypothetical protein VIBNIFTn2_120014 [Vibrio nigripulchritudo FTn2]|uniref:hypothetical protein n=1 Tax=Vibrio nigripulchritudo TaxID=28173 RepID=UPI0003B1A90F|nr:hypothetical protein [Vibrio nigripulchritudo]CCN40032.1 hypothetical protein VIBNIFTn2_120014 [Vibrio nigripulchritudo FTn2]
MTANTIFDLTFRFSKIENSFVFGIDNMTLHCQNKSGHEFKLFIDRVTLTKFNDAGSVFSRCLEEQCKFHWLPILNIFCSEYRLKPFFAHLLCQQEKDTTTLLNIYRIESHPDVTLFEQRRAVQYALSQLNSDAMFYAFDQKVPTEYRFAKHLVQENIPVLTFTEDERNNTIGEGFAGKSIAFFNYYTFS